MIAQAYALLRPRYAAVAASGAMTRQQALDEMLHHLWTMVAPWVLGFVGTNTAATQAHFVIGILVAALAAWELWKVYSPPAHPA